MPVCPLCARRVPASVTTCRCGHAFDVHDAISEPVAVEAESDKRSASLAGLAALGAVILGVVLWMSNRREPVEIPRSGSTARQSTAAARPATAVGDRAGAQPPSSSAAAPAEETTSDPAARVAAALAASKAARLAANTSDTTAGSTMPLEDVISRSMPAVVRVETSGSIGTGFFIAPDTILTNEHVVSGNTSVTIRRPGGATLSAHVDTTAPEIDMAVMKISSPDPNQPTLTMGSGLGARAGQEVIALGSPLGLQNTVTRGIVSAVREVGGLTLVQTDAAINPGNSGGPLLDRTGHVIGITSLGMRSSVAQGLGFAIAIEHAQTLLSGNRPTVAGGTPLTTLNKAMAAENTIADTRERASKAYEQGIAMVAQRADALDGQWQTFVRSCYQGQVVGTFDRQWYALWDARAMQGAVRPGCTTIFTDIQRMATEIRSAVGSLDEAARRDDVYPGARRDILRRYRLDYPGR
jgi:trypsin-like peptidase